MNKIFTRICIAILGLLPLSVSAQTSKQKTASRPNVILIYSDDQGSLDLNIYGAKDLVTPNLDKLARNGVRFSQFYAASPVYRGNTASCFLLANGGSQRKLSVGRKRRGLEIAAQSCEGICW